jgi:phosphoglycerate dehydrogenase-like enzyme
VNDPLRSMPGAIITPHIAGSGQSMDTPPANGNFTSLDVGRSWRVSY